MCLYIRSQIFKTIRSVVSQKWLTYHRPWTILIYMTIPHSNIFFGGSKKEGALSYSLCSWNINRALNICHFCEEKYESDVRSFICFDWPQLLRPYLRPWVWCLFFNKPYKTHLVAGHRWPYSIKVAKSMVILPFYFAFVIY